MDIRIIGARINNRSSTISNHLNIKRIFVLKNQGTLTFHRSFNLISSKPLWWIVMYFTFLPWLLYFYFYLLWVRYLYNFTFRARDLNRHGNKNENTVPIILYSHHRFYLNVFTKLIFGPSFVWNLCSNEKMITQMIVNLVFLLYLKSK